MFSAALASVDPAPLELDAARLCAFERDGYLHLQSTFSSQEVEWLRALVDECETRESGVCEYLDGGFFSRRGVTIDSLEFSGLACEGRLLGPAVQILGGHLRFLGVQNIRREPLSPGVHSRTPERHGWHRDIFGMSRDLGANAPRCALKCAILLSDWMDEQAGGTRFLPGSQNQFGVDIAPGEIDPPGALSPRARAGDMIIFENRTYHAGGINRSGEPFRMLLFQYGYRWLAPVISQRHRDHVLAVCSPLTRQILEPDECLAGNHYRPGSGAEPILEWARRRGLTERSRR